MFKGICNSFSRFILNHTNKYNANWLLNLEQLKTPIVIQEFYTKEVLRIWLNKISKNQATSYPIAMQVNLTFCSITQTFVSHDINIKILANIHIQINQI